MPRQRDPRRDEAFEIYKSSGGDLKLKDLAKQLDLSEGTIRGWKNKDGWDKRLNGAFQKKERNATNKKKLGAPLGNKNAKGNRGGGAPKGNQNAVTHGLFSRFIPAETLLIMDAMEEMTAADMIWHQMQIQYAAIMRAQNIMYVTGKDEMIQEVKKTKTEMETYIDKNGERKSIPTYVEREYEFQFSWDRHATFLNSLSRAMTTFQSLIRQFDSMADEADERRLKLAIMREQLTKIERENTPDNKTEDKLKEYFTALGGAFRDSGES